MPIFFLKKTKTKTKTYICSRRAFLILDDAEQASLIHADWLLPGRKVIITNRHGRLLKPLQIYKEELEQDESINSSGFMKKRRMEVVAPQLSASRIMILQHFG